MVLLLCVSETLKHIKNGGEKEQFCCSTSRTAAQNGLNELKIIQHFTSKRKPVIKKK